MKADDEDRNRESVRVWKRHAARHERLSDRGSWYLWLENINRWCCDERYKVSAICERDAAWAAAELQLRGGSANTYNFGGDGLESWVGFPSGNSSVELIVRVEGLKEAGAQLTSERAGAAKMQSVSGADSDSNSEAGWRCGPGTQAAVVLLSVCRLQKWTGKSRGKGKQRRKERERGPLV